MVVKKILGLASVSAGPLTIWYIRCWDNISTVLSRRLFGRYYIQNLDSAAWLSRKCWVWHLLVLPTACLMHPLLGQYLYNTLKKTVWYILYTTSRQCDRAWHLLVQPHCLSDTVDVGTTVLQYFWKDFEVDIVYDIRTVLLGCQKN